MIDPLEESFTEDVSTLATTPSRAMVCPHCGNTFKTVQGINRHISRHEGTEKYKCDHCTKRYTTARDLNDHRRAQHDGQKFVCNKCGKTYSKEYDYSKHVKGDCAATPTTETTLICDVCGYESKRPYDIVCHKRAKHESIAKFKCKTCGKSYRWRSSLSFHMSKHNSSNVAEGNQAHP